MSRPASLRLGPPQPSPHDEVRVRSRALSSPHPRPPLTTRSPSPPPARKTSCRPRRVTQHRQWCPGTRTRPQPASRWLRRLCPVAPRRAPRRARSRAGPHPALGEAHLGPPTPARCGSSTRRTRCRDADPSGPPRSCRSSRAFLACSAATLCCREWLHRTDTEQLGEQVSGPTLARVPSFRCGRLAPAHRSGAHRLLSCSPSAADRGSTSF